MQMSADGKKLFRSSLIVLSVLLGTTALTVTARPAFALSELKKAPGEEPQKPAEDEKAAPVEEKQEEPETSPLELPMPDPLIRRNGAVTEPADEPPVTDETPDETPQAPVEVIRDIGKAPEPVRRMR
jgi:hypothetical protein